MRSLPDDYYVHDEMHHRLVGRHSGLEYRLGQIVDVRLVEANPVTGGIILELAESGGTAKRARGSAGKGKGKGHARHKIARQKRRR
jgi:ribonuclease R